jgi:hypothetical protein
MPDQAIEGQFLPNMTEEEQKRFTPSELLLYKHAIEYKWTAEQLKKSVEKTFERQVAAKLSERSKQGACG